MVLHCDLKMATSCVGFGKDSSASQGQLLPVICPGLPSKSYKVILCWSLIVLDLEACGDGHAVKGG